MHIVKEIISEDCFDENFIKEYTLDKKITLEWIDYLKQFGTTTCLSNLDHPFYTFDKKYFFTIKGIVEEDKIKVIFRRNNMDKTMDFLNALIENFEGSTENVEKLKELEKNILKNLNLEPV